MSVRPLKAGLLECYLCLVRIVDRDGKMKAVLVRMEHVHRVDIHFAGGQTPTHRGEDAGLIRKNGGEHRVFFEGDTVLVEDSLESGWIVNNHSDDRNVVKAERRQGVYVDPSGCYRLGQGCETSRSVRYSNDEFHHLETLRPKPRARRGTMTSAGCYARVHTMTT